MEQEIVASIKNSVTSEPSNNETSPYNNECLHIKHGQLELYDPALPLYKMVPSYAPDPNEKLKKRRKKLLKLGKYIEKDFKAADLKWSLFVAACQSHKYAKLLNPFPPGYLKKDNQKDIDNLLKAIEGAPQLRLILQQFYDPDLRQVHDEVIDLMHWQFIIMKTPYLELMDEKIFKCILTKTQCQLNIRKPDYIFRVVNSSESEHYWQLLSAHSSTSFGFHGTKLENIYSILHNGLKLHFGRKYPVGNRYFVKGFIFISKENVLSLKYSPCGYGWGASKVAPEISCVVLCEYLDENKDCIQLSEYPFLEDDLDNQEFSVLDFKRNAGAYYALTDSDKVRVRYLLIYRKPVTYRLTESLASVPRWIKSHVLLFCLLGFGLLLIITFRGCISIIEEFFNYSLLSQ